MTETAVEDADAPRPYQPPTADLISEKICKAVADVIAVHESGFVTKQLTVVESVSPDGERGVWPLCTEGTRTYDTIGLLGYALMQEFANIILARMVGDPSDDDSDDDE